MGGRDENKVKGVSCTTVHVHCVHACTCMYTCILNVNVRACTVTFSRMTGLTLLCEAYTVYIFMYMYIQPSHVFV